MKNETLVRITLITGIFALGMIYVASGMPMSSVSPAQGADILLQPTRDAIAGQRAAMVAGDITVDEYMSFLKITTFELEIKTTLLKAIRDSGKQFSDKLELLNSIFPWNVRGVDGYAHGDRRSFLITTTILEDGTVVTSKIPVNHEASKKAITNMG